MSAAVPSPVDHLPLSLRDDDREREAARISELRRLYADAKAIHAALRSVTDQQRTGGLTRAEAAVLSFMVRQNLRACVRRERFYRPTREGIARDTGYSERTVSRALTRLRGLGCVVVSRYAKGGRLGDRGVGLATEFRSGGLAALADTLSRLGYRLGKGLRAALAKAAAWAADRIRPRQPVEPTGTSCPGTLVPMANDAPHAPPTPRAAGGQRQREGQKARLYRIAREAGARLVARRSGHSVPMPRPERGWGGAERAVLLSLPENSGGTA